MNKKKGRQLFVAPPNFQPNTIFVGRKAELEVLHTHLYHSRAQGQDPKSVLITGVPGSGKTHLAREYVFTHPILTQVEFSGSGLGHSKEHVKAS